MSAVLDRPPVTTGVASPATPVAPEPVARWSALLAVLAVIATLVLVPWSTTVDAGAGRMETGTLERLDGSTWTTVPVGTAFTEGDVVRTNATSPARLAVGEGGTIELAPNSEARLRIGAIDLVRGSVLTTSESLRDVAADGILARGSGIWRVDLATHQRVAVYAGGVGLEPGDRSIGRLEQHGFVTGAFIPRSAPLRYDVNDEWDADHLAPAIAVDDLMDALTTQFRNRYGRAPLPASFYADFEVLDSSLPDALRRFSVRRAGDAVGPPAAILAATVVAQTLVDGAGLTPADAVEAVDSLRARGATWGLIVQLHDLDVDRVRAAVDRALRERAQQVDERRDLPRSSPSPSPTPSSSPSPSPSPSSSPSPSPSPTPTPTEPEPTDEPGPTQPLDDLVDDVLDPVGDAVDDVVPGSGAIVDDVGDGVDTVTDVVDDLLGGDADPGTDAAPQGSVGG